MIDLISTVVPVVGALASGVGAVVAIEAVRGGQRRMEEVAVRVAGYADEARAEAAASTASAGYSWTDRMVVKEARAAVERERTIVTSIARTSKKHAQDAKAERLRATEILDSAADFAGEAAGHSDDAHDHAESARVSAAKADESAGSAAGAANDAEGHFDAADTSAREAASAADRAEEAAATIEQVL